MNLAYFYIQTLCECFLISPICKKSKNALYQRFGLVANLTYQPKA